MNAVRRLAAGVAMVCLTACVPSGLSFRVDDRLEFESPKDRATVRLPVRIDWNVRDFRVVEPGTPPRPGEGYFAVFVDRAPQPPGKPLSWIARNDDSCVAAAQCPDEGYYADRGVYATTETHVVLEDLVRRGSDKRKERHTVTVVLLDGVGARIGESAFTIDFYLDRP